MVRLGGTLAATVAGWVGFLGVVLSTVGIIGFSIMLFVRVKRSAPRINDMVELSRLANDGSQCPLANGVLRSTSSVRAARA